MKDIKKVFFVIIAFSLLTCTDDEPISFDDSIGSFVKFRLQVDSNNNVIEAPILDNGTPTVAEYTKDNFKELKIPVALTTKSIDEEIFIDYSVDITNLLGVEIQPENQLVFNNLKRVDTITVKISERWDIAENPQIKLTLTSSSKPFIHLGLPNNSKPENELIINFSEFDFTYQFAPPNSTEIIGNLEEQVQIEILFPNGYVLSEVENINFLSEQLSNFSYALERQIISDPKKIRYLFKVKEEIAIDILEFKTVLEMNTLNDYTLLGSNRFTITKPVFVERDNNVNTASNFYDLSNPNYRTFGENWLYDLNDMQCEWSSFFAFTYPVIVSSNHPNAVLYDDQDTTDPNDDIYHHAFRVGFNSPNIGNTTNSFNLKRWFTNESISAANSPGFNIIEALEFFPENGNSLETGIVRVIEQELVISGTNGNSYIIMISGEGVYRNINADIFEINLTLMATNNILFGGTVSSQYIIYNTSSYTVPVDLNENCVEPKIL